jgi:hypothetical protein
VCLFLYEACAIKTKKNINWHRSLDCDTPSVLLDKVRARFGDQWLLALINHYLTSHCLCRFAYLDLKCVHALQVFCASFTNARMIIDVSSISTREREIERERSEIVFVCVSAAFHKFWLKCSCAAAQ